MNTIEIEIICRSRWGLPRYHTLGAAGMDLSADVSVPCILSPGEWKRIPTGIFIALPWGYEAQIRPRSGLADQYGITVLNAPATIDPDYRGEIQVLLINLGKKDFSVEPGMRIAQLVVAPFCKVSWKPVETLPPSKRANQGFGHTGI